MSICTTNPTDGAPFTGNAATWPQIFQDLAVEEQHAQAECLDRPTGHADDDIAWIELRHRKWRALQKHLVHYPFTIDPTLPRADQWRAVLAHCNSLFFEQDITDWLSAQIHIAENLAAGIRDMRPRKNGPCYTVFMEFVRDRKRKYHVTLRWLKDAQAQGAPLTWDVPPQMGANGE